MGLDGGTIASRTDVLRRSSWRLTASDAGHRSTRGGQLAQDFTAGRVEEGGASARERRAAAWTSCALTGGTLHTPIVACALGKLYNRESVVQFLLSVAGVQPVGEEKYLFDRLRLLKEQFPHITTRKDVFEVRFHSQASDRHGPPASGAAEAPAAAGPSTRTHHGQQQQQQEQQQGQGQGQGLVQAATDLRGSSEAGAWVCPVTGRQLDGSHPCSALRGCGHVVSDRVLKQVKERVCPVCSSEYSEEDVVSLNRPEEEVIELRERLKRKKDESTKSRKDKKLKSVKGTDARDSK